MSENVNSVRIGSALGWARVAYAKNVLSFVALSVVVMILQFGQQFAAGPFTETFSRCVEAGGNGRCVEFDRDRELL